MNKINSKYKVPNLERALIIIELLKEHPEGLTLSEIAQAIEASPTSVFRISMTMIEKGYFSRDEETKRIRMSSKLFTVSSVGTCDKNISEIAAPYLRQLRNSTKETALLGVLLANKGQGVAILEYPGLYPFKFLHDIGEPIILHVGAPGKALLAFLPPNEQDSILSKLRLKKYTNNTIVSKKELRRELDNVKAHGYAVGLGEWMEEMHCISAPILDRFGYPLAVAWITGPASRMPVSKVPELAIQVKSCAAQITAVLQNEMM
ncbi:MAG: IclR family transcriptional regulator [Kiritimatiellales bacterium]